MGSFDVGLALELAAEPQKRRAETEPRPFRDDAADASADDGADDRAGDLADFVLRGLAGLCRAVPQHDVTQLVSHHAGDFAFGVRGFDHPAVDEHRSAWQREGVDLADVHDLERVPELRVLELGWHRGDEPVAEGLDVRRHLVVAQDGQLPLRFRGGLEAQLDVLRGCVVVVRRHDARLRHREAGGEHNG